MEAPYIPEIYDDIWTTDKFIIILTGGRGGGKSFVGFTAAKRLSYIPNQVIMCCRYTMDSAQDSIIPEFKEKVELYNVEQDFKITAKDAINLQTGVTVKFRGIKTSSGNQTAKLKGMKNLSTFIVDEGEEWRSVEDYKKLVMSTRSKKCKNRVIIIMNPSDSNHFVYDLYIKDTHKIVYYDGVPVQISTHPNVCHIHTTYMDNIPNLADNFLEEVRIAKEKHESLPEEEKQFSYYSTKIIGRWADKREGVVFTNWKEGAFDYSLPNCLGLDYGFFPDPLAMVRVAVDKKNKKIYVKQELYATKLSDEDIVSFLESNIKRNDLIVCDHNEPRTTKKIRSKGFNIRKAKKGAGSIAQDIRDIEDYDIIVDPDSKDVKKELNNYIWNDKKASIPKDADNHSMDAMRYAFRRLVSPQIVASYA